METNCMLPFKSSFNSHDVILLSFLGYAISLRSAGLGARRRQHRAGLFINRCLIRANSQARTFFKKSLLKLNFFLLLLNCRVDKNEATNAETTEDK